MSDLSFRPRFQLLFEQNEAEIIAAIKTALNEDNPDAFHGKVKHSHFTIFINPTKQHFWSPVLDISFDPEFEGTTEMRCLLAPSPTVWTLFMFGYSLTLFGVLIGLMFGASQMQLDLNPWGFYIAVVCGFLAVAFFLMAQYGKKLAHEEMKSLKGFVMRVRELLVVSG
ncbi:hypothetical protein [Crocinitomix catalasitica]|uniref:hypothetical protein n=1 Tax=Crocinitomix catalasitica TaxID=184607 RepID=UPI0004823C0E|nr:hypothetical protein [Crocinitomix catalasitica]